MTTRYRITEDGRDRLLDGLDDDGNPDDDIWELTCTAHYVVLHMIDGAVGDCAEDCACGHEGYTLDEFLTDYPGSDRAGVQQLLDELVTIGVAIALPCAGTWPAQWRIERT
jgi:hypothetical protein